MTNLRELQLSWNDITDISPLSGLTNLTILNLADNTSITDISPLSGLTNLQELWLDYVVVTDISPLSGLTNLTTLSLSDTNIPDISPLSGLTSLTHLRLLSTNTTDLSPLSGFTNLNTLVLSHNGIEDISPLADLTNLAELNLWDNNIKDFSPLSGLINLRKLGLGSSNISDISTLPGLTNLAELDLQENNITDISPLAGLINLIRLNLAGNKITDISPLSGLTNLQDVDLRGNLHEELPKGDYDIELVLLDDLTEPQERALQYAAKRWMAIIIGDLTDYEFTHEYSGQCGGKSFQIPAGERIDDLRIYVETTRLSSYVEGEAAIHVLREESHLPVVACITVAFGHTSVVNLGLHEIGHALGFASEVWERFGFYQTPSNGENHFSGPLAISAFDDASGRDYTDAKVPLDKEGTSHWSSDLEGEVMSLSRGRGALSAITVQSLADLGYVVDVTQADDYTLPDV